MDPLNGRYAAGLLRALAAHGDRAEGLAFARRHEGRLHEASLFHRTATLPGLPAHPLGHVPDGYNAGILAFERGEAREAARVLRALTPDGPTTWAPGQLARVRACARGTGR